MPTPGPRHEWPGASLARVPYWVYQDEDNYRAELRRIFEGPTWSYACLESDLEKPGDYRTTFVGEMPVIVPRGAAGEIHPFRNSRAHRGGVLAPDHRGPAGRPLPWRLPRSALY